MSDTDIEKPLQIEVKLNLRIPDNIQSGFATNFVIQQQEDHFVLSFYEAIVPPVIGKSQEEQKKIYEALGTIEARCVSRIVMTPGKMIEFVAILTKNIETYKKRMQIK